jgi:hypothetical protein
MTEAEYLNLKQQIEAHAERRHSEIEAEKRKQLDSLETIWNLFSTIRVIQHPPAATLSQGTFPLAEAIRQVLPKMPSAFNINDVIEHVEAGGFDVKKPINPTSVSGALRKMEDTGVLELIEAGKGKRPSKYKLAKDTNEISSEGKSSLDEQKGQAMGATTA